MRLPIHTVESAPAAARDILSGAQKKLGFVPNLYAMMASAPALVKAYTTLSGIFEETSFNATERQVILMTVSYVNECEYCVAAHTVLAGMQKVPSDVVAAIRGGSPIADPKLEALRRYTAAVVTSRGWPSDNEAKALLQAGYGPTQMLEVVLGVGIKILSNYANHIGETPLDAAFSPAAWSKAA